MKCRGESRPMLVLASSTNVAPPSSPNASVVNHGDSCRLKVTGSNNSRRGKDTTPTPINPLLLASACLGSSSALHFLFEREDKHEPPMLMPTQVFLDLLAAYTLDSSTRRSLADVEAGVDQHALPSTPSHGLEDGICQPALPTIVSLNIEDGVDQLALPVVASNGVEDVADQPALHEAAFENIKVQDGVDQHVSLAAASLLKGVTARGDTALHAVVSHGHNPEFLKCVSIIDERDQDLLFAVNNKGDTPLHCATRSGRPHMVSHLIELAENRNSLQKLLRIENMLVETALHDAVRVGNEHIVKILLKVDPSLANYPNEGTSPLYLAILLERNEIARTLYNMSDGNLSYRGSHGNNALHAAVLQGMVMTKHVLTWNNSLTTYGDRDGSTPLHLASSLRCSNGFKQILEANPASVFQEDNNGLFPIHVAASVGAKDTISIILDKFPGTAGLCTAEGRTFLHVAVMERNLTIVSFVCRTPTLAWILNMQDNDGNTALHLAVQAGKLRMFCSLYGNKEVQLILRNNNGQTALDLSRSLLPTGMHYMQNTDQRIHMALASVEGKHSFLCRDQIYGKYTQPKNSKDMISEEEKVKDASQMLGIGSVLIATVAFGVTFALPGGYRADDHINGGTPTLVGRYTFDAFMMANALAFICSSIATIGLMFSGSSMVKLVSRQINLRTSVFFVSSSLTSLAAAFALGVYMVLAPVAHDTAIAVCAFTPLAVLYRNSEFLVKLGILARPLRLRVGLTRAIKKISSIIFITMLKELWPFILIFGWAAIARKLRSHR
ncbi:ankyrin repeat-containing protein At5g02620-like isoform X1 [Triticum urartu]|nr:ankyrin repeat-containing protein At5g02620-like isoform X1 [Triticum urartu]